MNYIYVKMATTVIQLLSNSLLHITYSTREAAFYGSLVNVLHWIFMLFSASYCMLYFP